MKQALNKVFVDGILSENNLKLSTYEKDGKTIEYIGGDFKLKTSHKDKVLEIPFYVFAKKMTNAGKINPAYTSMEKMLNTYISIASNGGENGATCLRISGATISMNDYVSEKSDEIVSYPRIMASFVKPIAKDDIKYNHFDVEFVVASKNMEVDKEGTETGRLKIKAVLPQYGDRVDVVDFYVANAAGIDYIEQNWQNNDTVHAKGYLNFTSTTSIELVEMAFGEPQERTKTISVSELMVESGDAPYEGEFAYDFDEIATAMKARKARLDELKAGKKSSGKATPKTPAKTSKSLSDLGF